ncbi:MAG TPA: peptidoglycan DD-metalloendopeptidase family protein [Actinomycetota bacterium]|nr:peptidoglycan DD-metalloendopeptidase family protein [Actinomycetota bacterium]
MPFRIDVARTRASARGVARRVVLLGLAFLLIGPLLGPAPSEASNDSNQLAQTRKALAAIQAKLAQSKGEAAKIQAQVKALDTQIDALDKQVGVDTRAVADLESTIRTDDAKIAQLQSQYQGAHQAADARARSIYMGGPASSLSSLLSANSIGDFMRKTVVWQVAADLDAKVIIQSARLRDALAVEKQDLAQATDALHAKEGSLRSRADLLTSARGQRSAALDAVNAQIAAEQKAENDLEQESIALTNALANDAQISHGTGAISGSGISWPVNGPMGSPFGPRGGGFHYGIDILAGTGTPIRAAKDGTVAGISCGTGYGICTIIDHGGGVATLYAHMSRKAVSGGHVSAGEVIGYVGCTGYCTGPHLHFEVRINGSPKNPRSYLS